LGFKFTEQITELFEYFAHLVCIASLHRVTWLL